MEASSTIIADVHIEKLLIIGKTMEKIGLKLENEKFFKLFSFFVSWKMLNGKMLTVGAVY